MRMQNDANINFSSREECTAFAKVGERREGERERRQIKKGERQ